MKTLSAYILGLALSLSFVTVGVCQSTLSNATVMANAPKNDDTEGKKGTEKESSDRTNEKIELKKKKKEECKRKEAEEEAASSNLYFTTP